MAKQQNARSDMEKIWDGEWGEIDEYGFTFEISELEGFKIGDKVVVIVDQAEDPTMPGSVSGYQDDEGMVVGFSAPREGGGPFNLPRVGSKLYVTIEDMEPTVIDPADLDHA